MLQWIKRVFDSDKYRQSSITMMDQLGYKGSSPLPFNYRNAVRYYRSWVYAAAHINATAVAATPLRLYIRSDNRTKSLWRTRPIEKSRRAYLLGDMAGDVRPSRTVMAKMMHMGPDFEEVTEQHPILEMLQKANGVYNGFDLTVLRTLYQELTGNAYLHVITDPSLDIPVELWPMPSQHVQVVPSKENFIDGYIYGANENQALRFERDEVIHFKRPNPDNLFYGLGKVEAAYGTIQANQAVHDMDLATFANHARPDYAVVVNGNARRADLDIFEQHVSERLRGTRKSGQFLAVSGDVKFEPLNFPPKDLGGREEIVEEIAAVFGVPVSMLKANDPNLASARAGFGQWREGTILPLLRMDEDVLNQVLLPMFGIEGDACLAYDNPVPADSAFQLQQRTAAVSGGWQTLNEARIEQGLEPSENPLADELLIGGQPLGTAPGGLGLLDLEAPEQKEPEIEDIVQDTMEEIEAEAIEPSMDFAAVKSVLDDVAECKMSASTGIAFCKSMGIEEEAAREMVLGQVVLAQEHYRKQADKPLFDYFETPEEAEARALEIGCEGHHVHEMDDGRTLYMPCSEMSDYTARTGIAHEKAVEDVDTQPTQQMADLAERGLLLREEHGRGGTQIGVSRARDIKNRVNLSPETVGRMANFFSRHRVDLDAPAAQPGNDGYPSAGVIAWMLWGGDPNNPDGAGNAWAQRKLEEIDGQREKAMDCNCKAEGDRISATPAEPSERIEGSDRNKPGTAAGSRGGIEISEAQTKALEKKRDEHNEKHGDKKGKKVDLGMLKAVYRRGAGAFSGSHRPGMSRQQWAMARVNAFLYLVRNGRPKDPKYITDNDLLPKGHPKKSDK
jgi:HK97 family phage portal protein